MSLRSWLCDLLGFAVIEHDLRAQNAALRAEIAELKADNAMMRLTLMPLSSAAGAAYAARVDQQRDIARPATKEQEQADWQESLRKLLAEEEKNDGVHGERREEVRQPAPDDAAREEHAHEV